MDMYKVTQTDKKGYIKSISYQEANSVQEAIESAKLYHGYTGKWRAVLESDLEYMDDYQEQAE